MPSSPKFTRNIGREGTSTSSTPLSSVATTFREFGERMTLSPAAIKFVILCLLWYMSSALSNNSAKQILIQFKYPVTLTFVQFGFISGWCGLLAMIQQLRGRNSRALFGAKNGIRYPTAEIILTTLPLSLFQIAGHIFGSLATSQIPVSVVHTVKALSPLFTVLTYRFMFSVHYSPSTYLSLLPLTLGVMLACSFELSANLVGLFYALGSTIVFVSQNIFIKKLHFQESSATEAIESANGHTSVKGMFKAPQGKEKLDKLNILFYSSGMAFLLMIPLWLYNEGGGMVWRYLFGGSSTLLNASSTSLTLPFIFNGTVHFGQNIIAFSLLSVASPVAYSIAGLVKRIFVIVMSIIWFGQRTTLVQAFGIVMTFIGLYMYDRAKVEVARGERKVDRIEYKESHLLPLDTSDLKISAPPTPDPFDHGQPLSATSATETTMPDDAPRRRSSSLTDQQRPPVMPFNPNWGLGSIQEMTPPVTPRIVSPQPSRPPRQENKIGVQSGHRRRYSGSVHTVPPARGGMNGVRKGVNGRLEETDDSMSGIEEKASWE